MKLNNSPPQNTIAILPYSRNFIFLIVFFYIDNNYRSRYVECYFNMRVRRKPRCQKISAQMPLAIQGFIALKLSVDFLKT